MNTIRPSVTVTNGIILAVAGGLVILGSTGPWVTVPFASVSGMEGDGVITLAIGSTALALGIVGAVLRTEKGNIPAWFLLMGAGAVGFYDWIHAHNRIVQEEARLVEVGWGLQLLTVSAIVAVVLVPIIIGLSSFRVSVRDQ